MTLVILAANKTMQSTLMEGVNSLFEDVKAVSTVSEIQDDWAAMACVAQADNNNYKDLLKLAETMPVFALITPEAGKNDVAEFVFCREIPIRLGTIKNALKEFLKNRQQKNKMKPLVMGDYQLDPSTNSFQNKKHKIKVRLTEKEQDMLLYLQNRIEESVSKEELLQRVWDYADNVETHTLETHIYRLRQKIERDPANPEFLITDEDGYRLNF